MKNPILETLKTVAPNIHFSVEYTLDPNYVWDGDGPDPADEGYAPFDVDVVARAIEGGKLLEGTASLGGVYETLGKYNLPENPDKDIFGYLIQMLEEAVEELDKEAMNALFKLQLEAALIHIKHAGKKAYEKQMKKRK
jgi:hypothetical protein